MKRRLFLKLTGLTGFGGMLGLRPPRLPVHVYRINEYEWIAAHDLEEAVRFAVQTCGLPREEVLDDWFAPHLVGDVEMEKLRRWEEHPDEEPKKSFRQALADDLASGCEAPFWFAGTE